MRNPSKFGRWLSQTLVGTALGVGICRVYDACFDDMAQKREKTRRLLEESRYQRELTKKALERAREVEQESRRLLSLSKDRRPSETWFDRDEGARAGEERYLSGQCRK